MLFVQKLFHTLKANAHHPLKRHAPLRSAVEFCTAQVAVRLVPGDIAVAFPNQTRLLISPRMKGAAHFISPGLCEFEEMCFVTHFLRPGDLFADIGANVGAYTVLASGIAEARTVAFEPSPGTFRYLMDNIRINELSDRATGVNAALGGKEGVLSLTDNLGTENYICPNGASDRGIQVKVATLDKSFVNANPLLMKIDVEGFETEVMGGGERVLASEELQAMIVERGALGARYGYDEVKLHAHIRQSGFTPCAYSALSRTITQVSNEAEGNIIYVRDMAKAQERVRTARGFRFAGREI
jgi:FkbM family methyltransferase